MRHRHGGKPSGTMVFRLMLARARILPSKYRTSQAATAAGRDRIRPRAAGQRDRPPRRLGVGSPTEFLPWLLETGTQDAGDVGPGTGRRRAQRRSMMAEGHREAARSVIDGREHDGTFAAEGRQLTIRHIAVYPRILPPPTWAELAHRDPLCQAVRRRAATAKVASGKFDLSIMPAKFSTGALRKVSLLRPLRTERAGGHLPRLGAAADAHSIMHAPPPRRKAIRHNGIPLDARARAHIASQNQGLRRCDGLRARGGVTLARNAAAAMSRPARRSAASYPACRRPENVRTDRSRA